MSSRKRSRTEDNPPSAYAEWPLLRKTLMESTFVPGMNKYEQVDKYTGLTTVTVMIELPGLRPGNVTINLLHDELTISGQSVEPLLGEGKYILRELRRGKFSRVVAVPLGMRLEDFKARMENGLLTVTFPKHPPGRKSVRTPIESADVLDIHDD